jgi:hypothetical protein
MSLIDFYNAIGTSDNGQNTVASIQPILDGEAANQTIFQRPPENLRTRAELLRTAHDGEEVVRLQSDSLVIIPSTPVLAGPPTMTWGGTVAGGGTGTPVLSLDNLNLLPVASSASAPAGVLTANSQIAKIYADFGAGQIFEMVAARAASPGGLRRMHEGAGNIFFRAYVDTVAGPHLPVVTVTGGTDPAAGPIDIVAKLDNVAGVTTNTFTDLAVAITAAAGVNIATATAAGAALIINGAGTFLADTATRCRLFETPNYGRNGLDATSYTIPIATFAVLTLAEGDIVAIDFATTTLRRASNWAAPVAVNVIKDGIHSHIGNNGIIPLCKVINDSLHFFNGVVCPKGIAVSLIHDYAQRGTYAAHVAGTADKHAISHILSTTRPSLVVGPVGATGCDYVNDIQSAITALAATGGTIQIKRGTYTLTDQLTITAVSKPITIIGETPDRVIIYTPAATSKPCLDIQGPNNHVLVNLYFQQEDNGEYVVQAVGATSGSKTAVCVFDHCIFQRLDTGMAGPLILTTISMYFSHCQFLGLDSTLDIAIRITPNADAKQNITVENSYFSTLKQGIICWTAGTLALVAVRHCIIENCGNANGAANWFYFIDIGDYVGGPVATYAHIDISHNRWLDVGTAAAQCGGFCYTYSGTGVIAHNQIDRVVGVAITSATAYMIYDLNTKLPVPTSLQMGITIQNNIINCGVAAAGVGGICGGRVIGNTIFNFVPRHTSQYAILAASAGGVSKNVLIKDNMIYGHTALTLAAITCIYNTIDYARIIDNVITMTQADYVRGIYSTGHRCVIANNNIVFAESGTGIWVSTNQGSTVSGNIITLKSTASAGICVESDDHRIVNNYIYAAVSGGGNGILVSASCHRLVIKGNSIQSFSIGINFQMTHANCSASSNSISDCLYGIRLNSTTTRFTINDNNIITEAAVGRKCVYIAAGVADLYGTINNNCLVCAGTDAASACIDFGAVTILCVACGGNMFQFTGPAVPTLFANIGAAGDPGIGKSGIFKDMDHNYIL